MSLLDAIDRQVAQDEAAARRLDPPAEKSEATKPHFELRDKGVYWCGVDKDGQPLTPEWICSPLHITAQTRDAHGEEWGRVLKFLDPEGRPHVWVMPMELLKGSGEELRGELLRLGLLITTSFKSRPRLCDYIQQAQPKAVAQCVDRTGWHGGAFVFPKRTIGQYTEKVLFQAETTRGFTYEARGTLDDWRSHVAALCVGNSRLVFAVSAAAAALLVEAAGDESGGFHLRGDSSSGKTTALKVAASVYGGPDYLQRWRATDNGLEALAVQHNDTLLILDELAQVDPRFAGEAAYMLANGEGKTRANRQGKARPREHWRLLFLSAGEIGLDEHMRQAGKKSRAGQEARLADIPADAGAGLGVFENLHGHPSGGAFSRALFDVSARYYGTAAPAFIEAIIDQRDILPDIMAELRHGFLAGALPEGAGGQAGRVANRFALVAIGGEIATAEGITGWPKGEALKAAQVCFQAWMDARGGAGNQEASSMLAQVRLFFEAHGEARFTPWPKDSETCDRCQGSGEIEYAGKTGACFDCGGDGKLGRVNGVNGQRIPTRDRAGFRREGPEGTEYFVLPETFREICRGFDSKAVARLLVEREWLSHGNDGKPYRREYLPGMGQVRCYAFTPEMWGEKP